MSQVEVPVLNSLRIQGFRAFRDLEIAPLGRVNLLVGRNNVGKTTVLEAVRLFAHGWGALGLVGRVLQDRDEHIRSEVEGEPQLDLARLFHRSKQGEVERTFHIGSFGGDEISFRLASARQSSLSRAQRDTRLLGLEKPSCQRPQR